MVADSEYSHARNHALKESSFQINDLRFSNRVAIFGWDSAWRCSFLLGTGRLERG